MYAWAQECLSFAGFVCYFLRCHLLGWGYSTVANSCWACSGSGFSPGKNESCVKVSQVAKSDGSVGESTRLTASLTSAVLSLDPMGEGATIPQSCSLTSKGVPQHEHHHTCNTSTHSCACIHTLHTHKVNNKNKSERLKQVLVVCTFNLSTWKAKAGALWEYEDTLVYIVSFSITRAT